MSYEGYTEWKCAKGHVDQADVYDNQPLVCRECGERWVKRRSIDQTNEREYRSPWRAIEYRPRFKDYVAKGYRA